jgi:hypothetical protein
MNKILSLVLVLLFFTQSGLAYVIELSKREIIWLGDRIFANECSSRDDLLLQWNDGEDFLSLGIGHFIWYPKGERGPFKETFPDFIEFAKLSGADIPACLSIDLGRHCPWRTKEDFLRNQNNQEVTELRIFLQNTKPLQAEFIIKRFKNSIPVMIQAVHSIKQRQKVENNIERLLSTARGAYAIIDYANFKGMGVSMSERYKGQGWGLLQVLLDMRDEDTAPDAVKEFSESADRILTLRVENSPKERNEQQWLVGWRNRVKTYYQEKRGDNL